MPNPYDGYNPNESPASGGYDQHTIELARQAGMIPLAAGAQAAPIPGQAAPPPQKHGFDMSKLAALGQYAAAGAIPGWGGPAAIGMLALRDYLKSRKNKRAAMDEKGPGGISIPELLGTGAKAAAANPAILQQMTQDHPELLSTDLHDGDALKKALGYAKGGLIGTRRKFTGVPSTTMRKPRPNPTPAKVKAPATTTPKMHKMTAPAIRFATGGLVRGCGMAVKGKKCGKKC